MICEDIGMLLGQLHPHARLYISTGLIFPYVCVCARVRLFYHSARNHAIRPRRATFYKLPVLVPPIARDKEGTILPLHFLCDPPHSVLRPPLPTVEAFCLCLIILSRFSTSVFSFFGGFSRERVCSECEK